MTYSTFEGGLVYNDNDLIGSYTGCDRGRTSTTPKPPAGRGPVEGSVQKNPSGDGRSLRVLSGIAKCILESRRPNGKQCRHHRKPSSTEGPVLGRRKRGGGRSLKLKHR